MSSTSSTLPYLVPNSERVQLDEWVDAEAGGRLEESVKGWDRFSVLTPSTTLRMDLNGVRGDCGLPSSANLGVVVECVTGTTGSRWSQCSPVKPLTGEPVVTLVAPTVSGAWSASTLELRTVIVLLNDLLPTGPHAHHRGARIWEDVLRIDLDGDSRGMPVHSVDLGDAFPGQGLEGAPWFIEMMDPSPDTPFLTSFVVFLNTRREEILLSLQRGTGDFVDLLQADIIRTVVHATLMAEVSIDAADLEDCEAGTLGAEVRSWLMMLGLSLAEGVRLVRQAPDRFAARVASTWRGGSDA